MVEWAKRRMRETDWYWQASEADRREYDAFGPWIDPVRSEAEMPPRFRAVYAEHKSAHCLLKVPIRAERENVRPGMDLYRMVIAVHDDRISFLQPAEDYVVTRSIAWEEIAAVRNSENLMIAGFSLLLKSGDTFDIEFSAVSIQRLEQVTDYIRNRLTHFTDRAIAETKGISVPVIDHFYKGMQIAVHNRVRGRVTPLHFEPSGRFCRDRDDRRRLSTGLLVLDTGDELVIVDRGAPSRRFFHPTYQVRLTFVPYVRLSSFSFVPPPREDGRHFHGLALHSGDQTIDQSCLMAPDEIMACLNAHGIMRIDT